jgi:hypothetical protein
VDARNNLTCLLDLDDSLDYDSTVDLVARWHPYAGIVYFHMLLASLAGVVPVHIDAVATSAPAAAFRSSLPAVISRTHAVAQMATATHG